MPTPAISVTNLGPGELEVKSRPLLDGRYGLAVVLPGASAIDAADREQLSRAVVSALRDLATQLEEGTD